MIMMVRVKKSKHFELIGFDVTVNPYGSNCIWIKNKGKSGIFGNFSICPSEGKYGFGVGVSNSAGDVPLCVSKKYGKTRGYVWDCNRYFELTQFNEAGRKHHKVKIR